MTDIHHEELRRADAEARRRARHEHRRPFALEAGAGTGKTATLVARILVWCLGPGWERHRKKSHFVAGPERGAAAESFAASVLDRVVAITFTERASVEMSERVATALDRLIDGDEVIGLEPLDLIEDRDELRMRAGALFARLDRFKVETIHAFCRRLLAAFPLEAGLRPDFEIDADGRLVKAVVDEALTAWIPRAYGSPGSEDARRLLVLEFGPRAIADALDTLIQSSVAADEIDVDPYAPARIAPLAAKLRELASALFDAAAQPLREGKGSRKKALAAMDSLETLVQRLEGAGTLEELTSALEFEDRKALDGRLSSWRTELTKTEAKCVGEREAEITAIAAELHPRLAFVVSFDAELLLPALRELRELLDGVRRTMRERGIVTFNDLLRSARDLLRDDESVRNRVRASIDQLLVDEVQDTDPMQYELVELIALDGPEDERPGLFLVGDPKQTIYGFRSADIGAYQSFIERIGSEGGELHRLSVNFRSVPAILAEVERICSPIMVESRGVQAAFERLLAAPDHLDDSGFEDVGRRPIEHWVSWDRDASARKTGPSTSTARAQELEARALAAELRELHDFAGMSWGSAALLFRATTQQETYLEALRTLGIPYQVEKDRQYFRRREIIDATSAISSVLDPHDQVSLVAFLRSPMVGVPDAALIPLWEQGLPGLAANLDHANEESFAKIDSLVDQVRRTMPEGLPETEGLPHWPTALAAALRHLAVLRASAREDPVDIFVERFRGLLMPEGIEAGRFLGAHRLANLDRFLRQVLGAMMTRAGGAEAVLAELRRGVYESRDETEGSPGDDTVDAVRVMSIHKAKGLDFDHVYLVDLHHGLAAGAPRQNDVARIDGKIEIRLFGVPTPGFAREEQRRAEVGSAELVRLFYVAATRARSRLVFCGRRPSTQDPARELDRVRNQIDLLSHRDADTPDLEALVRGSDPDQSFEHLDDDGVRWFFPASQLQNDRLAPTAVVVFGNRSRAGETRDHSTGRGAIASGRAAEPAARLRRFRRCTRGSSRRPSGRRR